MAQYAILIYAPAPGDVRDVPAEEMAAHSRYAAEIEELDSRVVSGYALQASSTATSIRGDIVTDGPFTEAKEVVAGFCVIEARDHEHAVEIARRNPATWRAGVEVRPLLG